MNLPYRFPLHGDMLFENSEDSAFVPVTDGEGFYSGGALAYWRFTTRARRMRIRIRRDTGYGVAIPVAVDDVPLLVSDPLCGDDAYGEAEVWLPEGLTKKVEIFIGTRGGSGTGDYPMEVAFDAPATPVSPATQSSRLLIYGDSIAQGSIALSPLWSFGGLLKRPVADGGYDGDVFMEAYGGRRVIDDTATSNIFDASKTTNFVTRLIANANPTQWLLLIGTNDYGLIPGVAIALFEDCYEGLLDEIISQQPAADIFCCTPLTRTPETANASGHDLDAYRSVISTAVAARSSNCTLIDGTGIITTGDLADAVHPDTGGHALVKTAVLSALTA